MELIRVETEFPLLGVDEEEQRMTIFDWFIFGYKLKSFNKTPLEHFIDVNKDMSLEEKKIFESFRNNIYSLFEVKALKIGKEMILKDLATEKEYWVWERTATQQLHKGQCIFSRLLPYEDHYILSGLCRAFPREATYILRLGYKRMRKNNADMKLDPKIVAEIFHGFPAEDRLEDLTLDAIKEKLSEKLKGMELTDSTISDIIKKFNKEATPEQIFGEISKKAVFPGEEDMQQVMELLIAYWNKMPYKSMNGISP